MAIPAQRFKFLDKETNLPSQKFTSELDSSILNTALNGDMPTSESLQSLIDSAIQSANDQLAEAESSFNVDDIVDAVTRSTKDIASSLIDLTSLSDKGLTSFLSDIIPDVGIAKNIKGMLQKCKTQNGGYGIPGRPYDVSMNCGAGNVSLGSGGYGRGNSCNAGSYANLLNKLSGGDYNAEFNDYNKLLQALMSLGGMGYNLDMCGVFSALSSGMPNDVLSKGAGGLLSVMGQAGKTNAVLDIASSAVGLTPLLYNPSATSTFLGNYKKPKSTNENGLLTLASRTMAGLELLDDGWNKSDYDNSLSLKNASTYSSDLDNVLTCKLTDKSYGLNQLDEAPSLDDDFLFASYSMSEPVVRYA